MPLSSILGIAGGLAQGIIGGINARKAQKQLEKMQSPTYQRNQSILDYYNQALARYNTSPTDSAMYKRNMGNINRNVAAGISGLQGRRSVLGGLPSLLRGANDAALDTEVAAEGQRDQRFSQLGQATEAKAGEDRMAFQQNELAPFERKYNLLSQRAGANAQTMNAGLSNIFSGLQNMGIQKMYKDMYGGGMDASGRAVNQPLGVTTNPLGGKTIRGRVRKGIFG